MSTKAQRLAANQAREEFTRTARRRITELTNERDTMLAALREIVANYKPDHTPRSAYSTAVKALESLGHPPVDPLSHAALSTKNRGVE